MRGGSCGVLNLGCSRSARQQLGSSFNSTLLQATTNMRGADPWCFTPHFWSKRGSFGQPAMSSPFRQEAARATVPCLNARDGSPWRIVGIIVAAALVLSLPFALVGELPGERWLSARDSNAPVFAALGALLLGLDVLLPVPSSAVGVMLGARLGFGLGFACCLLGLVLGHAGGYGLGRLAPQRWTARVPSAPSMLGVFVSRPVPVLAEALAVSAGVARMPLRQFVLATVLGDVIYAAVLCAAGAQWLPAGSYAAALLVPMLVIISAGWAARRWVGIGS
jgi:uncharacterized membrane protein YdjX (TVP38/TMEM64 family)